MSPSFPIEPTPTQEALNKRFTALNSRLTRLNLVVLEHISVRMSCLDVDQTTEVWVDFLIPDQFLLHFSAVGEDGRVFNNGVKLRDIAVLYMNNKRRLAIKELAEVAIESTTLDSDIKALYASNPDSHLRMLDNWIEEIKERLEGVSEGVGSLDKMK